MPPRAEPDYADLGRRIDRRRWLGRVLSLARHLPAADRRLIEQVYAHGVALHHIAQLTGRNRHHVARRLAALLRRMRQPAFRFVAEDHALLPEELRPVARLVFVDGHTFRAASRMTGRSLHQVRLDVQTLNVLARLLAQ